MAEERKERVSSEAAVVFLGSNAVSLGLRTPLNASCTSLGTPRAQRKQYQTRDGWEAHS